jgi:hypothetical protein
MLKRCLKRSAERNLIAKFQWLGAIEMHTKGGDDDMIGFFGDRSAEMMFQIAENYEHWGPADRTDLI